MKGVNEMYENYSLSDIAAATGDKNNTGWGGDWGAWIIIFLIFGIFGWGGNGFGGFGGNSGATDGYILASDFANIERKLDSVNNGICDGFYAMNTGMLNGFGTINQAIMQNGYESRLATQGLGSQMASCCCDIREGIQANTTQGVMNTNAIQQQLAQCCCDNEKQAMQNRFDMAQYNCSTLQAIDKVGDRIIDYLAADKTQALRDENQALRFAASQTTQNAYLLQQLNPYPVPAYTVCNPRTGSYGYNNCNGCC